MVTKKPYFFSFFCYSGRVQRVLLLEILEGLREEAAATADAGMLESGALEGKNQENSKSRFEKEEPI